MRTSEVQNKIGSLLLAWDVPELNGMPSKMEVSARP
jgi:hypothetical protein